MRLGTKQVLENELMGGKEADSLYPRSRTAIVVQPYIACAECVTMAVGKQVAMSSRRVADLLGLCAGYAQPSSWYVYKTYDSEMLDAADAWLARPGRIAIVDGSVRLSRNTICSK